MLQHSRQNPSVCQSKHNYVGDLAFEFSALVHSLMSRPLEVRSMPNCDERALEWPTVFCMLCKHHTTRRSHTQRRI